MQQGSITPKEAARQTHRMRNALMEQMRAPASPPGTLIAQSIKPAALPYSYYLNRNTQKEFGKDFAQLNDAEAARVAGLTIDSAGRANRGITKIVRGIGPVSKGLIVVSAVASAYQVVAARNWKAEIEKQVASWSGAIADGELGGEIGGSVSALVGPVGAIMVGIAGGIIGGLAGEASVQALARWFFGGSSQRTPMDITCLRMARTLLT